ncbi:fused MFS/spermidine synthase [Cnuibacter physcomitrellae]|uniref:spermidine synthase n=1 Tax=Cnuibacter physcomitrellae TaxID=1619308 RepID=UPI00217604A2|nr:fused MFS/spermidine synthase [Cnuibacter physcomitrellae]MCS5498994.1 fused MFS/spermidine synthase [Cnuibacter physcomitrellae]
MTTLTTTFLARSGELAALETDELSGGLVLRIRGHAQSHVHPGEPERLHYDYMRRMAAAAELALSGLAPGRPARAVHLGAGALTFPRWVQARHPGADQTVLELEPDLVDFVTAAVPLPSGTRLELIPGDAAETTARLARLPADLVVADMYRGTATPPHLMTPEFYAGLGRVAADTGVLLVNVADDDGLPATFAHVAALVPTFPHAVIVGPSSVVEKGREGNAVIVASRSPRVEEWAGELLAAGPHPGAVVSASSFGSTAR